MGHRLFSIQAPLFVFAAWISTLALPACRDAADASRTRTTTIAPSVAQQPTGTILRIPCDDPDDVKALANVRVTCQGVVTDDRIGESFTFTFGCPVTDIHLKEEYTGAVRVRFDIPQGNPGDMGRFERGTWTTGFVSCRPRVEGRHPTITIPLSKFRSTKPYPIIP